MSTLEDRLEEYIKARGLEETFSELSTVEKYEAVTGIINPDLLVEGDEETKDTEGWHIPGGFATSYTDVEDDGSFEEDDDSHE